MRRLLALARLEISLWLRTAGFWLAVVAMHLYGLGALSYTSLVTSRGMGEQIVGEGLLFGALFVLFTSAAATLRDRSEGTEELIDALPATNAQLLLARWLAGAALWLAAGLELFAVTGIAVALRGGVLEIWPLISFYLSHFVPAVLFVHTLGAAAAVFIREPFVLYPVLTGIWAAAGLGVMALSFNPWWQFVTLFHLTGIGYPLLRVSALVGIYPFEGYVFWQRAFFAGLTLLLGCLALMRFRVHREAGDARRARRMRASAAGAAIAVVLAVLGAAGYTQQYLPGGPSSVASYAMPGRVGDEANPLGAFEANGIGATGIGANGIEAYDIGTFDIEAYDLNVTVRSDATYAVSALIDVRNAGSESLSEIRLLLHSSCRVTEGGAISLHGLSRQGDVTGVTVGALVVTLGLETPLAPGEARQVELAYECPSFPRRNLVPAPGARLLVLDQLIVPESPTIISGLPGLGRDVSGADAGSTRMGTAAGAPGPSGFDPGTAAALAGEYSAPGPGLREKRFTVTVDGPPGFRLALNLPRVAQTPAPAGRLVTRYEGYATKLEAFGGPLAYEVIDGVETYYYPVHAEAAHAFVSELADRIAYYERWLGKAEPVPGVTPLPVVVEHVVLSSRMRGPRISDGFLAISEWNLARFHRTGDGVRELTSELRMLVDEAALSLWWGTQPFGSAAPGAGRPDLTAVESAANQYLAVLYRAESSGPSLYDQALELMLADWEAHREGRPAPYDWSAARELELHTPSAVHTAVFLTLHEVRSSLGDEALAAVLRAMQQRFVRLARGGGGIPAPEATSRVLPSGLPASEEASLRFLFQTIGQLPGGAGAVERALRYWPNSSLRDQLRWSQ